MDEPIWLDRTLVDAMHFDQLQQHGGLRGIRDENALEATLARPRQRWTYEPGSDIFALAAAYGFGLATTHGYIDGNERIAFVAMYTLLGMNDWEITAAEPEVVRLMLDVASGGCDEAALTAWLRDHVAPYTD